MIPGTSDSLEGLIRGAGQDWLIDQSAPTENALPRLQSLIERVSAQATKRWGQTAPGIDLDWLNREQERNPHKVQAFLQALGSTDSLDMLLMVWCILEGWTIQKVQMDYTIQKSFRLRVTLQSDRAANEEIFESTSIDDAALLRHLGIMTMDGAPILDGFYPLKLD